MALAHSTLPFAPSSPAPSSRATASFPPGGVHFAAAGRSGGLPLACAAQRHRGRSPRRRRGGGLVVWASADYYATLGVSRSASDKDIKAAYRMLARQPGRYWKNVARVAIRKPISVRCLVESASPAGALVSMAGAVAATSPPTARFNSSLATRRSFRVSCGHEHGPRASAAGAAASARNSPARVPACFSRNPADAEAETETNTGQILQDDSSYLWKLGLGSVGGAAAIKYGSILFPDITRPNIIQALLMVCLPVAVAVLILFKLSSTED